MAGLLDAAPWPQRPVKLTEEWSPNLRSAPRRHSVAALVAGGRESVLASACTGAPSKGPSRDEVLLPVGGGRPGRLRRTAAAVLAGTPAATPARAPVCPPAGLGRSHRPAGRRSPSYSPSCTAPAATHPWERTFRSPRLEALTAGFELLLACTDTAGGTSVSAAGSSP